MHRHTLIKSSLAYMRLGGTEMSYNYIKNVQNRKWMQMKLPGHWCEHNGDATTEVGDRHICQLWKYAQYERRISDLHTYKLVSAIENKSWWGNFIEVV